jgi:hypothetical protein
MVAATGAVAVEVEGAVAVEVAAAEMTAAVAAEMTAEAAVATAAEAAVVPIAAAAVERLETAEERAAAEAVRVLAAAGKMEEWQAGTTGRQQEVERPKPGDARARPVVGKVKLAGVRVRRGTGAVRGKPAAGRPRPGIEAVRRRRVHGRPRLGVARWKRRIAISGWSAAMPGRDNWEEGRR